MLSLLRNWLTIEEVKWKPNGELTTHSPSTYKIPAVNDMPEKFNVKIYKNLTLKIILVKINQLQGSITALRDFKIVSMPPSSSGGTHLVQMLNMLEEFNVKEMGFGSSEGIHILAEIMKRSYNLLS